MFEVFGGSGAHAGKANITGYFAFLGLASSGTDRQKLENLFSLFDTQKDGMLRGTELNAIAQGMASSTGEKHALNSVSDLCTPAGQSALP